MPEPYRRVGSSAAGSVPRSDSRSERPCGVDATGNEMLIELSEPEETSYEDPYLHDAKQSWYPFAEDDDSQSTQGIVHADD